MLSQRLKQIINMVPKATTIADIGCDHGKISVALIRQGIAEHVICTDISGQSLKKARKLVETKGLEKSVSFREGNGMLVLDGQEADVVIIAGMGGELIADILKEGGDRTPDTLVLSCNTASGILRKWLTDNGYRIDNEALIFEMRHFYPIIRAVKDVSKPLTDMELEFGPVMLQKKPRVLKYFVRRRIEKTKEIRSKINKANAKNKQALLDEIDAQLEKYAEVEKCL